ncbi:MAG: DUF58 domain-containing protein [Haloplanus sp.]
MIRLRPTRRGVAVAAIAVAGVAMSVGFGPRSLDAIVVPAGVALVAAGVQLYTLDAPGVERSTPPDGDPGTTETVTLSFVTDTPVTAVVRDRLPPGLDGDAEATTLVGGDPFTYPVTYRERGTHALGPTVVRAHDVLGLARRTFVVRGDDDAILVYPRVFYPSTALRERLQGLSAPVAGAERGSFDHLREYTSGDPLRDVHWKSSAKRNALVVQEFVDDDRRTVTMAARAADGRADRLAEAAASVGCALLDEGVRVVLRTPEGQVAATPGNAERLLAHLARVGAGHVERRDADVVVDARDGGTRLRIGGETTPFDPGRRRQVGDGDGATDRRTARREVTP